MRYRNLIIGSILGAIIGATLVFAITMGSDGGQSGREPTTAFTIFLFTLFAILFGAGGGLAGAQVGAIEATDLDVALDSRPYRPGESVDVQVSLRPTKSLNVRRGQVRLVCLETFYEDGGEGVFKKSSEQYLLELPFLGREHVLKGLSHSENFKFTIPEEAPASLRSEAFEDSCADISWRVEAALDIVGARDIHQARVLTILPLVPDPSPPAIKEYFFDQGVATLSLSSTTVRGGETVDGGFSIQIWQDFRVRGIRVELECWEKSGVRGKRTVKDLVLLKGKERLSEGLRTAFQELEWNSSVRDLVLLKGGNREEWLTANQVLEWPIRLQVPKNALPSTEVYHTQVVWRVKGILDMGLRRRSLEVQQQIQVYIAPADS